MTNAADRERTSPGLDVSGYIRRARRLADLNQRELAAFVGVHQSVIARIERGRDVSVQVFADALSAAGLRLAVVDSDGRELPPMPADVFQDRAGRRQPSHLDVRAAPDVPTTQRLLRGTDAMQRPSWHARRPERDRQRAASGARAADEQLTRADAADRRQRLRSVDQGLGRPIAEAQSPPADASPPTG